MAWLGWVLVGFLAVALVGGVIYLVADRRGWITSERAQRFLGRTYGLGQSSDDKTSDS